MAGRNQHYIPQFFQRGFGVPRSGKSKEIWEFTKGAPPKLRQIKEAAADFDFYSPPSADGSASLDDKITDFETPLALQVAGLRKLPFGSTADPKIAAEVVAHLAPRTSHLRLSMARGMAGLFQAAAEIFNDQDNIKRLLGLDADTPTERFKERIVPDVRKCFGAIGLPEPVLENVAFTLAKEESDALFAELIPSMTAAMAQVLPEAESRAKEGHNRVLASLLENNVRRHDLEGFTWTIESAPDDGAVLPDCVALGIEENGSIHPFMTASREVGAVVMPLASSQFLVGGKPGAQRPNLSDYNANAAACSYGFFLAAGPNFYDLAHRIGERSISTIDQAIDSAVGEYRSPLVEQNETAASTLDENGEGKGIVPFSKEFSYQLTFLDCADRPTSERIAETIKAIVGEISQSLPLGRLDGIIFAGDYTAGLASVDIGVPGVSPPETVGEEVGVGVAMTIRVMRDEIVKCRIVLAGGIGPALTEEDHPGAPLALHVLVHELALVAMTHWFEQAFPNVLFKPWADPHEGRAYAYVNASVDGYVAARMSAGFGNDEITQVYQEFLISALTQAKATIPAERFAYRTHGNLDAFLGIAYSVASNILQFAGKLLGHCAGQGISPFDGEGTVAASLEENGLRAWFSSFQRDLERVWTRLGRWESLDELFLFNRHLERILWQFGIFPWLTEEREPRVEIPLAIDEPALWQGILDGTVPIPEGADFRLLPPEVRQALGISEGA